MRPRSKVMGASLSPERPTSRMEPMIDYFMEKWWGMVGSHEAMLELGEMVRKGLPLTPDLVDHVAAQHVRAAQRRTDGAVAAVGALQPRPPREKRTSWVYFIRIGDRVKIGTSVDPAKRAVSLSLRVKDVVAVIEGDHKLEKSLHRKFAGRRIDDTEWFTWCDEIAGFVETSADPFTKDHRAYQSGAPSQRRDGYTGLARRLDNGG